MTDTRLERLASAFRRPDGSPRFELPLPEGWSRDAGARVLALEEARRGGYEYPTRRFFDDHLEPGDLFIDVGAHWGIFSLHAATRHPGEIQVLAVEAHPGNLRQLRSAVELNGLAEQITVAGVAAGAAAGNAPLVINSTMGHSLHGFGLPTRASRDVQTLVRVRPLDELVPVQARGQLRRILLKIDVEGFEPEVVKGARRLLDTGRVAALVWENGRGFLAGERREAMLAMVAELEERGFALFRFPHPCMGGPLIPFAPTPESFNVFALGPGFARKRVYPKPWRGPEPVPAPCRSPGAPGIRAATTRILQGRRATDGARWADFESLGEGAEERARRAAALILPGSCVLDLGAGSMALREVLPPDCSYRPADLLPFDRATEIVDLNQGQFPAGSYDVVAALHVLEFLHDPGGALRRARVCAPRLVLGYHLADHGGPEERRQRGYFNVWDARTVAAILATEGWRIEERGVAGELALFGCVRSSAGAPA